MVLAVMVGLALSFFSLKALQATSDLHESSPHDNVQIYLPVIFVPPSPRGSYDCDEYEYGLIWTTEVITLNIDGSSVYAYNPPYPAIVTGTWVYTPSIQEVGFTNFRWLTATYEIPNRLWASQYLAQSGFEIALSCNRQ